VAGDAISSLDKVVKRQQTAIAKHVKITKKMIEKMAPKPKLKPKVIKIVHKPTQKKAETCKAPKSHNSSLLKKDK